MPGRLIRAAVVLVAVALAGCAEREAVAPTHPNLIIVRDFTASPGVMTLDRSFGFSLYRGAPGVSARQRAASLGRAAAFTLADTLVEQLRAFGYDAVHSNDGGPEPGGRALVVTGAFRNIDEGSRRSVGAEGSSVAADIEVDYLTQATPPQRLMTFQLDSRQVPQEPIVSAAVGRGESVNAAAARMGAALARTVAELARRNSWPGAPR